MQTLSNWIFFPTFCCRWNVCESIFFLVKCIDTCGREVIVIPSLTLFCCLSNQINFIIQLSAKLFFLFHFECILFIVYTFKTFNVYIIDDSLFFSLLYHSTVWKGERERERAISTVYLYPCGSFFFDFIIFIYSSLFAMNVVMNDEWVKDDGGHGCADYPFSNK